MTERKRKLDIAALTPPIALLNILIGVLTAASVNLLTTVATSDLSDNLSNRVIAAAILFALAALCLAALTLSLDRIGRETQLVLGPSLTAQERRAVLLGALRAHSRRTAVGISMSLCLCLGAGYALAIAP